MHEILVKTYPWDLNGCSVHFQAILKEISPPLSRIQGVSTSVKDRKKILVFNVGLQCDYHTKCVFLSKYMKPILCFLTSSLISATCQWLLLYDDEMQCPLIIQSHQLTSYGLHIIQKILLFCYTVLLCLIVWHSTSLHSFGVIWSKSLHLATLVLNHLVHQIYIWYYYPKLFS